MKLYTFWRSTTSHRVRAVLNLKGVPCKQVPVDLVAGDQRGHGYAVPDPGQSVPPLGLDDGTVLTQSLAIIDYLDATYREPPMLPADAAKRSWVQATALAVATDIHPVNNLRVLGQLISRFGADAYQCLDWIHHWMAEGFDQIAALVDPRTRYVFGGETRDLADICISTQVYNARRWESLLERWPRTEAIETASRSLPAVKATYPDNQSDTLLVGNETDGKVTT